MTISGEDEDGKIYFREHETLVLQCSISKWEPVGLMKLVLNKKVVVSKYTKVLEHTLNFSIENNGAMFTCKACDEHNMTVLTKSVTLSLCSK